MQEYCAALNIVNMSEHEAEHFVKTALNESNMEMTRKLLYGVMMNDKTTRVMNRYLEYRVCSIKKCREILFDQLVAMISDGIIRDIRLITLLHECGEETIEKIKSRIHSIHMDIVNLIGSDQIILASMIKQCSPLDEVYLREFWLNPSLLAALIDCPKFVTVFQAGFETEDSIDMGHIDGVMKLFDSSKLLFVMLHSRDEVKNEFLRRWIARTKVDFGSIGLINLNSIETLNLFFQLHQSACFRELKLCLSEEFARKLTREGITITQIRQIGSIRISDKALTGEKINAYIKILELVGGHDLAFYWCSLTAEHLRHTVTACKNRNIKLTRIRIWDGSLSKKALQQLVSLMAATACKSILFTRCKLGKEKLHRFGESCKKVK